MSAPASKPTAGQRAAQRTSSGRQPSSNPIKLLERKLFEANKNIHGTFSLGMLEPWEIIMVLTVFTVLTALLWYSLFYHFPSHLRKLVRRAIYYIYGSTPTTNGSATLATALREAHPASVPATGHIEL